MAPDPDWYAAYHSDSIRLNGWDYRRSAWYFLTICTENRRPHFGTIREGIVGLSRAGCLAAREWRRTPAVRPYVRLDAWIVMPNRPEEDSRSESGVNHVHGILGITTESPGHDTAKSSPSKSLGNNDVETSRRDDSTQGNGTNSREKFRLHAHSVGAIIGQYKLVCTKQIRAACRRDFGWQARFYDRILRNRQEFEAARRYVHRNPATWTEDRHFQSP